MGVKGLTIAQHNEGIKHRGLKCIGGYRKQKDKAKYQCAEGHEWYATPDNVFRGRGCPICKVFNKGRYVKLLEGTGIELVSGFINTKTDAVHKCEKGHEIIKKPNLLISTIRARPNTCNLCRECLRLKSLKKHNRSIASRGVKCISGFTTFSAKALHRCAEGHEWLTTPSSFLDRKRVCPFCSKSRPVTLAMHNAMLAPLGIVCFKGYKRNKGKSWHRCSKGHEWLCRTDGLRAGGGCPSCSGRGFSSAEEGYFYSFRLPNGLIKIGITNKENNKERYAKSERGKLRQVYKLSKKFTNGADALAVESKTKRDLAKFAFKGAPPLKTVGVSEVFHLNEVVLGIIRRNLKYSIRI